MTLAEVLSPGASNEYWKNFKPDQWWYCLNCNKVCQAKALEVWEDGEEDAHCPFCDIRCSDMMFWFHGWPSLVLDRWTPYPEHGQEFRFPRDWEGDNSLPEEPGTSARPQVVPIS